MRHFTFLLIVLLFVGMGCDGKSNKTKEEKSAEKSAEALVATMKINPKTENVLYTYMDEKLNYQTVESSDDVPDPYRNDVIVVNLSLPPEQRQSAIKVVVADLNSLDEMGNFKLKLEDRAAFEKSLKLKRQWKLTPTQPQQQQQQIDPQQLAALQQQMSKSDKIILYATSWCGYCRKARTFFKQQGIPFIEKDIEKDNQAAAELQAKCAAQKVQCGGVPVIDWKGRIIPGYDEPLIRQLVEGEKKAAKTTP